MRRRRGKQGTTLDTAGSNEIVRRDRDLLFGYSASDETRVGESTCGNHSVHTKRHVHQQQAAVNNGIHEENVRWRRIRSNSNRRLVIFCWGVAMILLCTSPHTHGQQASSTTPTRNGTSPQKTTCTTGETCCTTPPCKCGTYVYCQDVSCFSATVRQPPLDSQKAY